MISERNDIREAHARISPQTGILGKSIRCICISDSEYAIKSGRDSWALGASGCFTEQGAASKITASARDSHPADRIDKCLDSGAAVNVLQMVSASLDSVSSGIACYIAICDLMGI